MTAVATPQAQLFDRLIAQGKDAESWAYLVLSACEGEAGLARYLDDGVEPPKPKKPARGKTKGKDGKETDVPESPRAYLEAIAVRGFRGIGPESALKLRPGPGLTLVIGRNGSGKSSFAEALEVLLTGTSVRWSDKGSRFWKEGWRNLHDGVEPLVRARLVAEGIGQVELTRSWSGDQEVDDGTTVATGTGKKLTDLAGLGWESAVQDFRPFMSHSELASRFEDGPSVLYRALLKGLGLEAFEGIRECLAKAQAARRKQKSEAKDTAKLLIEDAKRIQAVTPDERIAETITLLGAKDFDLDRLGALATGTNTDQASLLSLLAQVAREKGPDGAVATQTAEGLRFAAKAMRELAAQEAGRSAEVATLLQSALTLTAKTGDTACPVCETPDVIDADWRERTAAEVTRLREAAKALQESQRIQRELERSAQALCGAAPVWLADPRLDEAVAIPAREAWKAWRDGQKLEDADALAAHLEQRAAPLVKALESLAAWAEREIAARQDVWQPLAQKLGPWVDAARAAARGQQQVADLKKAEDWVRDAIDDLRTERFEPIAARAREYLGPDAPAEQRRSDRDQARRLRQGAVGRPRGDGRRQAGRRAGRHVAGRAELAGIEPVPAARLAAGQPIRVRDRGRSRAGDGSGPRRRPRAGPAGDGEAPPGHRLHARRSPARSRQPSADRSGYGRSDAPRQLGGRGAHPARARRRLSRGRARADVDGAKGRRA